MTVKAKKIPTRPATELSSHVIGAHNIDEVIASITKQEQDPLFIIIDLFCGAGGTTTGFAMTGGLALVVACVNHDYKAIKSHWHNHPEVAHFEEDIRVLDLRPLARLVAHYRKLYPNAKIVLWASLPCPHFSRARGAQPKDDEIRTMAFSLIMNYDIKTKKHIKGDSYVQLLDPDYIMIENVEEFMSWGPLDDNGKPISKRNGADWIKWKNQVCKQGYSDQWRHLNSADFGAHTSRNRLFGCFAKEGLPIIWPEATHSRKPTEGMFGNMKPWRPVKEVLDFSDEGSSIFNRKRPLSDKTLSVIYKSVVKALKEGNDNILYKYYGNGDNINSINVPAGTLTTKDRFAKLCFIFRQYKTGFSTPLSKPLGTIPTNPKAHLVSCIMNPSHGGHATSINNPCPVIVARQDKAPLYLIQALMSESGIIDIKMRMLKVSELLIIQGFPSTYHLDGSQADQKKFR